MINKNFILKFVLSSMLAILPMHYSGAELQYVDGDDNISIEANRSFYIKGFYNIGKVAKVELNPSYEGSFEGGKKVYGSYDMSGDAKEGAVLTNDYYIWPIEKYRALYDITFKNAGASLGYYINSNSRLELEGIFGGAETRPQNALKGDLVDSVQIDKVSYFYSLSKRASGTWALQYQNKGFNYIAGALNAYYDFAINDIIKPYVGAGVGLAKLTFQSLPDTITYPAVIQGKFGATFVTGTALTPYIGYRLLYLLPKEMELVSYVWGSGKQGDGSFPMKAELWKDNSATIQISPSYLLHHLEIGLMISL